MEILAGLSFGLLILVALAVVVKTIALWRRTRGLPELLLSGYLLGATVLGYPLMTASTRISPSQAWPLHLAGPIVTETGFLCLLLFTLKIFRPGALWARCALALCCLLWAGSCGLYLIELTGESPRLATELLTINLLTIGPIAFAYLWTTIESLSYYRQLKLRLALGLSEIAVANRMLLWGLMTLAAGIASLISLGGALGHAAGWTDASLASPALLLVFSVLGLAHACCLFLAFHPPAWYQAWLEREPLATNA